MARNYNWDNKTTAQSDSSVAEIRHLYDRMKRLKTLSVKRVQLNFDILNGP